MSKLNLAGALTTRLGNSDFAKPAMAAAGLLDWLAIVTASIAGAVGTFSDVGFQFGIIELRIVAHQAAFNAAEVALHAMTSIWQTMPRPLRVRIAMLAMCKSP